jgi:hypothetical protein
MEPSENRLKTIFVINNNLANSVVSGKYFWFYASLALLSVAVIPAAIVRRRERLNFKVPDLRIEKNFLNQEL